MSGDMAKYNLAPDEALITNWLSTVCRLEGRVVAKSPTYVCC